MSAANENALRLLLAPAGQCPLIGAEDGAIRREGISILKNPHGSIRYIFASSGQAVAALQVMVGSDGKAVATNVYTDPQFRRQGLARQLAERAQVDFRNLQFSEERSDSGAAWVEAVNPPRLSTAELGSAFKQMVEQAPEDLAGVLFNWNESELNADRTAIVRHPGRDGAYSRGANGGTERVRIADFIRWLKSDAPFDTKVYGPRIEPDWRAQIIRLRGLAGERPSNYYEGLIHAGFIRLPNGDARNYVAKDGTMLPTLERSRVRVSMSSGTILYLDRGRIMAGIADDSSHWTVNALVVDRQLRRTGLASKAMKDITGLADRFGIHLYLEPTPIDDDSMSSAELAGFYARFGFEGQGPILTRTPRQAQQEALKLIADANGDPLVLYHGTRSQFNEFRPSRGGEYGSGIYFTDSPDTARLYAERATGPGEPRVIQAHLLLKNPFITSERGFVRAAGVKKLRSMGHDGIIATSPTGERQYVVFSASQIHVDQDMEEDRGRERMRA